MVNIIRKLKKSLLCGMSAVLAAGLLTGCCDSGKEKSYIGTKGESLTIVSGSENKELEPILEEYADQNNIRISMVYKGSLDIMHELEDGTTDYDAIWPASSVWLNMGDTAHRVKYAESISINPVVFGIKKSLAEELGFVDKKDVSIKDILAAIQSGKLNFCMTSATQSNSGASAYIGFIYALLGTPDVITESDLDKPELQEQLKELLSGIDRSSGSSDWLKDMFVKGDYDAMVNYECLTIAADNELTQEGREPLYVVYPFDGLSIADSPLGYIDNGDSKKEEAFKGLQKYLLSSEAQDKIQRTGRRSGYTGVSDKNKDVFKSEWGLQPDRVISPFKMPDTDTIRKALNLYQTALRKPSATVYCLDFSGSMSGDGEEQLTKAMEQLLIQANAAKNYLQASDKDINIIIPFNEDIIYDEKAEGNGTEMENLYQDIEACDAGGGTNMYTAILQGMDDLASYGKDYNRAIVVMTDGESMEDYDELQERVEKDGSQIPVFSIMYGDADKRQLEKIADLTNARVFDGRDSLTDAFRKVKGYN